MTNTTTLTVQSEQQPALQNNLITLKAQANAMVVTNASEMTAATDFTKNVKLLKKSIEDDKEAIFRPAKTVVDEITRRYKPMLDSIAKIEKVAKDKILKYQVEEQRKAEAAAAEARRKAEEEALRQAEELEAQRKSEEEAIRKASEEQAARLRKEGREDEAESVESDAAQALEETAKAHDEVLNTMVNAASKEQKVESTFNTGNASSTIRKVWDCEVENIELVPKEFLLVDMIKVRAAMREGHRDISGIRFFQKEQLSIK